MIRFAKKRRRNLPVKRLVPGKILQGPVTRVFDRPKVAVKTDDAQVATKNFPSDPMRDKNGATSC